MSVSARPPRPAPGFYDTLILGDTVTEGTASELYEGTVTARVDELFTREHWRNMSKEAKVRACCVRGRACALFCAVICIVRAFLHLCVFCAASLVRACCFVDCALAVSWKPTPAYGKFGWVLRFSPERAS